MKCKDCSACIRGFYKRMPDKHICISAPEPFIINDINEYCVLYHDEDGDKKEFEYDNVTSDIKEEIIYDFLRLTNDLLDLSEKYRSIAEDFYELYSKNSNVYFAHKADVFTLVSNALYDLVIKYIQKHNDKCSEDNMK